MATRQRHAEKASDQQLQNIRSARSIARLMTTKRGHLTRTETVSAIEQGFPMLADARALVDPFHAMIRKMARLRSNLGSMNPSGASLSRSRPASQTIRARCTRQSPSRGSMVRWKPRPSLSSSNVKCTGAPSSISFRPNLSAHREPESFIEITQTQFWTPIPPLGGPMSQKTIADSLLTDPRPNAETSESNINKIRGFFVDHGQTMTGARLIASLRSYIQLNDIQSVSLGAAH